MKPAFPPAHFYSPEIDPEDLAQRRDELWPARPEVLGIDFDEDGHRQILAEVFPRYVADYDYPDERPEGFDSRPAYYSNNPAFGWLDSRLLLVLLRQWRPRRLIEVGCGYSTLLICDVNARFLSGAMEVVAIEPHPADFLRAPIQGLSRQVEQRVEAVAIDELTRLEAGDVLFIDSSHVAKTGSDVNHLVFEVLPRLTAGVRIHFHDIFLPHEYPADWVLGERRSWNEQYLVRALLMYSRAFRVVFGSSFAHHRFPDLVAQSLAAGRSLGGGSLWIERVGE